MVGSLSAPAGSMPGYTPSSHVPFVNELACQHGIVVVVVFLDEFYMSKKFFVCGS